jgi:hypothetical protein
MFANGIRKFWDGNRWQSLSSLFSLVGYQGQDEVGMTLVLICPLVCSFVTLLMYQTAIGLLYDSVYVDTYMTIVISHMNCH